MMKALLFAIIFVIAVISAKLQVKKNNPEKTVHNIYSFMFISWICGGALFFIALIWIGFLFPRVSDKTIRSHLIYQASTIIYLIAFILALVFGTLIIGKSVLFIVLATLFIIVWSIRRTFIGYSFLAKNQLIKNPKKLLNIYS